MARKIDSVCQQCRREGIKLYLKGTRCESPKCAIERRNSPPGMHNRRGKLSEYGVRLREKQKLKRFYGVLENQFVRYFSLASKSPESTGEALPSILEPGRRAPDRRPWPRDGQRQALRHPQHAPQGRRQGHGQKPRRQPETREAEP